MATQLDLEEFKKLDEPTRWYFVWQELRGIPKRDELDKRYAGKLTEKIMYGMIGTIITAVLWALLTGVVKAAELIFK